MPSKTYDKVDARPESGVLYARLATKPPTIRSGSGVYLITSDGRKILDATGGAAVACLGHNNTRVKDAVTRQMDDIAYCYAPFFTTAPAEELAIWLCASTDWQMSRVFIVSSGE
jgi:adenosylmethionine-8-amino-7-oxononanoate aminotransferase